MIDKRTAEKIRRIKEAENEDDTGLSKKTSFSSFYNLEEQMTERDIRNAVSSQPKLKSAAVEPKKQEAFTGLLCSRPGTGKRRRISKRLK